MYTHTHICAYICVFIHTHICVCVCVCVYKFLNPILKVNATFKKKQ